MCGIVRSSFHVYTHNLIKKKKEGEPSEEGEVDEAEEAEQEAGPADARGFFHRMRGGEKASGLLMCACV